MHRATQRYIEKFSLTPSCGSVRHDAALWLVRLYVVVALLLATAVGCYAKQIDSTSYLIRKTADFQVNGLGNNVNWNKTSWVPITIQESANRALATKTKVMYSSTGLYFLFQCEDETLTATIEEDFGALFKEDVVEVFLWPDTSVPIYFEYEVSPLNYELPILVPNLNGKMQGWKPWNYTGSKKTQHATSVQGGEKKSHATITGWTAEFYIPYGLMHPIIPTLPVSGTKWRGNLYRIDYDKGYQTWSWRRTSGSFHEFKKYGILVFE